MATLRFEGQPVEHEPGETVLDSLLRAGHPVPHACRAGACQSCLVRAVATPPPDGSQSGLNEGLKARGFFLACAGRPSADLDVEPGDGELPRSRARIVAADRLGGDVLRVLLDPETAFEHRAGQFLTLIRDDGLARSYSIASLPGLDPCLELHVRVLPDGRMGRWLAEEALPGDVVTIQGPAGHCFYTPGQPDQEIILAGPGRAWPRSTGSPGMRSARATPRRSPCSTRPATRPGSTWTARCATLSASPPGSATSPAAWTPATGRTSGPGGWKRDARRVPRLRGASDLPLWQPRDGPGFAQAGVLERGQGQGNLRRRFPGLAGLVIIDRSRAVTRRDP